MVVTDSVSLYYERVPIRFHKESTRQTKVRRTGLTVRPPSARSTATTNRKPRQENYLSGALFLPGASVVSNDPKAFERDADRR